MNISKEIKIRLFPQQATEEYLKEVYDKYTKALDDRHINVFDHTEFLALRILHKRGLIKIIDLEYVYDSLSRSGEINENGMVVKGNIILDTLTNDMLDEMIGIQVMPSEK